MCHAYNSLMRQTFDCARLVHNLGALHSLAVYIVHWACFKDGIQNSGMISHYVCHLQQLVVHLTDLSDIDMCPCMLDYLH